MKKSYETFGNYILLEKLAAGGMAEVYLAKKIAASGVQKFVAIKRILQQFSDSEDFIAMFKDEAKIAINLSHSNVVSIYDFGIESSQFYIVMEFVEGRNLRQVLNRMKRVNQVFSVAQVAYIIRQVAAGLDHAHRCIDPTTGQPLNIIHRDMSPQNVMLSFEGDSKIVDFGIAKAAHQIEATRAGTLKGKFGYMSPEQVEGQSVDARTDIFALGIMTWEMLANQRLFLASSEINTLRKIRECDVPSLRKINPNIPTELDQIVKKALEKDKMERYQSAGDLHRDLQGFLSRFDPDFSVQDLGQFVKNLFSDEIIEIRKKQILYAQVTVDPSVQNDRTEVFAGNRSNEDHTLSEADLSFSENSKSHPNTMILQKAVGSIDFANAEFDDGATRAHRMHVAKRTAHEKTKEYKKNTYTDTKNTLLELEQKNRNATLLTLIFSLSFLLIFFAYLNKFHPDFKSRFCKSLENYNLCPRAFYIPTNLLILQSSPDNAEIYIDNELFGITPKELLIKKLPLKLTFRKDGHRTVEQLLKTIPKDNTLSIHMPPAVQGYFKVKSIGVEIYVDGRKVKSNQQVSVPAGKDVLIKVVNPFSGQSKEEVHRVDANQLKSIFIDPPTTNGL